MLTSEKIILDNNTYDIEFKLLNDLLFKFRIGSVVMIKESSIYYIYNSGVKNPINTKGTIISIEAEYLDLEESHFITVAWSNGTTNLYRKSDLKLLNF